MVTDKLRAAAEVVGKAVVRLAVLLYVGPAAIIGAAVYVGGWLLVIVVPILLILRYVFGVELLW